MMDIHVQKNVNKETGPEISPYMKINLNEFQTQM